MSDNGSRLEREIATLKTLRDELRVQVHLAKSEAKERFDQAEKSWHELEGKLNVIRRESKDQVHEVGQAARYLADEIRDAYKHIRELI